MRHACAEALVIGPAGSLVLGEENHDLPLARVTVTLRTGATSDPEGQEGLAAFASELCRRGAAGRGREALDAAFEGLGASFDVVVDHDAITFDVEGLSRNLDQAVALLADVLLRPDFPVAEADVLRRESHAALDELRDDDASLARRFHARHLFPAHPYGRPRSGTDASIDRLTAEGARRFFERAFAGGDLLFGFAGDLAPDRFQALLARHFGALRSGGAVHEVPPDPLFPSGLRLQIVDKPERTQSQILLGHPAPRWSDPDYLPLLVAAHAFGGTFTARLMTEIRVKRGLSYGASARMGLGRGAKAITVTVFPSLAQTPETLALVLDLWRAWVQDGVSDDEVAFAKTNLASAFGFQIATPEDRLDLAASVAVCGLPGDYRERFVPAVLAVEPAEVRAAMARRLHEKDLAITIVSTAKKLRPLLRKLSFDALEVTPHDTF
ncbi:MAG: insulinase family protein [Myxococcales bacterium]|nr:insulinase family protein [Myxococcales bacterium]